MGMARREARKAAKTGEGSSSAHSAQAPKRESAHPLDRGGREQKWGREGKVR